MGNCVSNSINIRMSVRKESPKPWSITKKSPLLGKFRAAAKCVMASNKCQSLVSSKAEHFKKMFTREKPKVVLAEPKIKGRTLIKYGNNVNPEKISMSVREKVWALKRARSLGRKDSLRSLNNAQ